jgi:hypothetical protein
MSSTSDQTTRALKALHADERGVVSILTVFAALMLTMLLGMVINVGHQVNGKVRMQNAADAAAYSGAVGVARGLNGLAYTNHLLSEVFAVTAILREGRDRNSDRYVPEILTAWKKVGETLRRSGFPRFETLGAAIVRKVPLEQDVATAFSNWMAAASELLLPEFENILRQELIPEYQRDLVRTFPEIAQMAAAEAALRDGTPDRGRGPMVGFVWRTTGVPVGGGAEALDPTLPVVDPAADPALDGGKYLRQARDERRQHSHTLRRLWNNNILAFFDYAARMSQYANLWRSFTCGQLDKLLDEYPLSNLPFVLRTEGDGAFSPNQYLDRYFTVVGVTYWRKVPDLVPGLFENPSRGCTMAYAEARVFVPQARLIWVLLQRGGESGDVPLGGLPGSPFQLPPEYQHQPPTTPPGELDWDVWPDQGMPDGWHLFNQHWTVGLVPATTPNLAMILQQEPPSVAFQQQQLRLPSLGELGTREIGQISPH